VICANWGIRLREKIGFKRSAVAVARKLSVIMHAMPRSGELFKSEPITATA
jgi:transposase